MPVLEENAYQRGAELREVDPMLVSCHSATSGRGGLLWLA